MDADGDGLLPSTLNFGAAIDLISEDGAIALGKIKTNGSADLNLTLQTSFDDSVPLPYVETDLDIDIDLANPDQTGVAFRNVQVGVGGFLNTAITPMIEAVQTVTNTYPIKDIALALKENLPVINKNAVDISEKLGILDTQTAKFISLTADLVNIINSIPINSSEVKFDFGNFVLDGSDAQENGLESQTLSSEDDLEIDLAKIEKLVDNLIPALNNPDLSIRLDYPIFEDPEVVLGFLLGKPDVDLVKLDLPSVGLAFDDYSSPPIPIFGPISAELSGLFAAGANFDFGLDTYGLTKFKESGFSNPLLIAQGLYISEEPAVSNLEDLFPLSSEQPYIFGLGGGITAGVGINGPLRAKIEAGIVGEAYLRLETDSPDTNKRHIFDPGSLDCLFELDGGVDAFLGAKFQIGFGPFAFRKRITLVREELANFHAGCSDGSGSGGIEEDGILTLKTNNGNDLIVVNHTDGELGNETIEVNSYAVEYIDEEDGETSGASEPRGNSSYSEINQIEGDGGKGRDRFELSDTVLASAFIKGGGNDDEVMGGSGADTLEGGDGDDYLSGGKGNDILNGNDDNDFLEGGEGNNTIDGGEGFDSISYVGESEGIVGNLSTGDAGEILIRRANGQVDSVINVEQFDLTNYNDELTGSDKNEETGDIIDGLKGDDIINGLAGDDFLIGGLGADRLDGGDEIKGDGTSYINSFNGVEIYLDIGFANGGEATGDELISIEHVLLSIHDDKARGNEKQNIISGSEGNDVIEGRGGGDTLDGGGTRKDFASSDEDELTYENSQTGVRVSLNKGRGSEGEAKDDEIEFAYVFDSATEEYEPDEKGGYSSFENLTGSKNDDSQLQGDIGNNIIKGLAGDDRLDGHNGNDILIGGFGADYFDGGDGDDWIDYSESPGVVYVSLEDNIGRFNHAEGDTFKEISGKATAENLLGSKYGDTLIGDDGDNEINPGLSSGGSDFVDGREGKDKIIIDYSIDDRSTGITGGFFNDKATSGFLDRRASESDLIIFQDAVSFQNIENSKIIGTFKDDNIRGGGGRDEILTGAGDDVAFGGDGNDDIRGDDGEDNIEGGRGRDRIQGGNDDDILDGGAGDDFVFGDNGNDLLIGGSGSDYLSGGAGIDRASYETSSSGVVLYLDKSRELRQPRQLVQEPRPNDAFGDIFHEIEEYEGSNFADEIYGDALNNYLLGASGNDLIEGGLGADIIDGGAGNDEAIYQTSDTGVSVDLTTGIHVGGHAEGDQLISIENIRGSNQKDTLRGDSKNNELRGGLGNDTLIGEAGNDILIGYDIFSEREIDTLTGGNGEDQFHLGSKFKDYYLDKENDNSYALITDYSPNEDSIYLRQACSDDGLVSFERLYTFQSSTEGLRISQRSSIDDEETDLIAIVEGISSVSSLSLIAHNPLTNCPDPVPTVPILE